MRLSQNKIVITGATRGIGRELTVRLAALSNTVIAVGRNEEHLKELITASSSIIPYVCDVGEVSDLYRLSSYVESIHGDCNILINNAGIQFNYNFGEETNVMNKIDREVSVNLLAPLRLSALLTPVLIQNNNAAIVNVSSGLGLVPKSSAPVYCATKAAIHIFSKSLRWQMNKIRVFEIIPPLVDTDMTTGRGSGKITPAQLVDEFLEAFANDKFEVHIGKVKLLKLVNRIAPSLAERIMRNGR